MKKGKKKLKEVKIDSNVYSFYVIVEMLYFNYRNVLPEKIVEKLYSLYKEIKEETEKGYYDTDIENIDFVKRVFFN